MGTHPGSKIKVQTALFTSDYQEPLPWLKYLTKWGNLGMESQVCRTQWVPPFSGCIHILRCAKDRFVVNYKMLRVSGVYHY